MVDLSTSRPSRNLDRVAAKSHVGRTPMKRRDLIAGSAGLITSLAIGGGARAQAWPARDITIIVAVGPGSSADAVARRVARVASRELGVPVQVKNVLGGAGLTGFAELAAARPDG